MIAMVCAATALTAFAQTPSPTPACPPAAGQHEGGRHWGGGPEGPGGPMREALESLTPAERQQLKAAHEKAEADPAVAAAHENAKEAMKAAHEAMKAAMLKADPTIGPILDKLDAARKDAKQEEKPRFHRKDKGAAPTPAN